MDGAAGFEVEEAGGFERVAPDQAFDAVERPEAGPGLRGGQLKQPGINSFLAGTGRGFNLTGTAGPGKAPFGP